MRSLVMVVLAACQGTADEGTVPVVEDPPSDPTVTDPTPTDPPACVADPDLAVVNAEAVPGPRGTQVELRVDLSVPASLAVLCTSRTDPTEQHLLEDPDPAVSHVLRLSGLRPSMTFDCSIAPTCPTVAGDPTEVTFDTPPPSTEVPLLAVEVDPALGMTGSYTLGVYEDGACSGGPTSLAIWDDEGRVRWSEQLPEGVQMDVEALYHPDDGTIVWGGGESENGRPHVIDLWDQDAAIPLDGWEDRLFHHDAKRIADGRVLLLEDVVNTDGTEDWQGFGLEVWNPETGAIDFTFDSQPLVDDGTLDGPSGILFRDDPYHANWMAWTETATGPELYVSLCFSWQLLALDADTGEVLWLLDDHSGWTVKDADGSPLSGDALPQCQHGLEVDGDRFLFYDNGQGRGYSQAVEWRIDAATHTATRLWSWSEDGWNEETLGDVDDLGNDRVLITQAHPECWSPFGDQNSAIVEVDRATGKVASRMTFPRADDTTYRSERYDGCTFFARTATCPALAARRDALADLF